MRLSKYLFKSQKFLKEGAMEEILRCCAVNQQGSGIFEFGPLGTRLMKNLENIVRKELDSIGGLECRLPLLQVDQLWIRSGRIDKYGSDMFKLKDRHGKTMVLAPTAEEAAVNLVHSYVNSYKQLPIHIYQILEKYRDEIRPRFGLVRARQFTMKDAYSFCATDEQAEEIYMKYYNAYLRIFKALDINIVTVPGDNGEIGGKFSHEFVVECDIGEDVLKSGYIEPKELDIISDLENSQLVQAKQQMKVLELGHIFYLDKEYSEKMKTFFMDEDGKHKPYIMGCYGLGISRILAFLSKRAFWPECISPFKLHIVGIDMPKAEEIYKKYEKYHDYILFDDRNAPRGGSKFHDADALKIPYRLVIGKNIELYYKGVESDSNLESILDNN